MSKRLVGSFANIITVRLLERAVVTSNLKYLSYHSLSCLKPFNGIPQLLGKSPNACSRPLKPGSFQCFLPLKTPSHWVYALASCTSLIIQKLHLLSLSFTSSSSVSLLQTFVLLEHSSSNSFHWNYFSVHALDLCLDIISYGGFPSFNWDHPLCPQSPPNFSSIAFATLHCNCLFIWQ